MKNKIIKTIVYGIVALLMICFVSFVTYSISLTERPGKDALAIPVFLIAGIVGFALALFCGRRLLGIKTAKTIAWLSLVFVLTAVLFYFAFAPYNHKYIFN